MNATSKIGETHYIRNANLVFTFLKNAASLGEKPLLFQKTKGKWIGKTWNEVADAVRRLAGALVAAGVKPRDRVLISAENRPEWVIADLAIMSLAPLLCPPIQPIPKMIMFTSWNIQSRYCNYLRWSFASRVAPAASRSKISARINGYWHRLPDLGDKTIFSWQTLIESTEPLHDIDTCEGLDTDDTCCFVYTSGTGGRPKFMLTHRSIRLHNRCN